MEYRADIDGLRTVAVLLVLVFHFDLFAIGRAGFVGVDIFFVISGFLITGIICRDLEAGRFHFGYFLYRRIRRLYPALVATLFLTLVAGWFLFLPYRYAELATETLWSLLYVVNFYFWRNVNYFGLQASEVPLLHMWSLAIEEQFYFFFPLVCWGIWRWFPRLLLPAVILGMLTSFGLGLIFAPIKPELSFYLLPTRAWELLLGSLLALMVHNRQPTGFWLYAMGPLGFTLIASAVVVHGPLTQVPGWFLLLPTLGAAAMLIGGYATHAPLTRMMASKPMVWVGKISYPLYLVHWPIRIFLQEHTLEFTFEWRVLGFVFSFLVAANIYYLIETPVRRGQVLAGRWLYVGLVSLASVAILSISGLIIRGDGVPGRFAPEVSAILAFREDTPSSFQKCEYLGDAIDQFCGLGNENAEREVLVIGDSHALALSGALDVWLTKEGRGGALWFNHGCMPVLGAGGDRCQEIFESALAFAKRAPGVKEVVLVSIWRQGLPVGGKPFEGRWVPEAEVAEVFEKQLIETVSQLRTSGKRVTIIEPFFAALDSVPETLAGNIAFERDWPVDETLAEHMKTFETIFDAFETIDDNGVRRVSLIEPFCDDGICRAVVEERPLFTDNNHLAFSHAESIAQRLLEQTETK